MFRSRPRLHRSLAVVAVAASVAAVMPNGLASAGAAPVDAPPVAVGREMLATLNAYRMASGLEPVVEDAALSDGAAKHACYSAKYGGVHSQSRSHPEFTIEGYRAAVNGVISMSGPGQPGRVHVEDLLTAPLHAMAMLHPQSDRVGFGRCDGPRPSGEMYGAAVIDVYQRMDRTRSLPATPYTFPGAGSIIGLNDFRGESPDPTTFCAGDHRRKDFGLPIWVSYPRAVAADPSVHVTGPDGPVDACVLTKHNTTGLTHTYLDQFDAVLVFPFGQQQPGTHTATVAASAGTVTWSWGYRPDAGLPSAMGEGHRTVEPAETTVGFVPVPPIRFADSRDGGRVSRLVAGATVRVRTAGFDGIGPDAVALAANVVAVRSSGPGYLTVWDCEGPAPMAAALNFRSEPVANQVMIPVDGAGDFCLRASRSTDVVIDVNGTYVADGARFVGVGPTRLLDSRTTAPLRAGVPRRLDVAGRAGIPADAVAVALNVTVVRPGGGGWLCVMPTDDDAGVSSLNFGAGDVRGNSVIAPLGDDGEVWLTASVGTNVVVDVAGYFAASGSELAQLGPYRWLDTRERGAQNLAGTRRATVAAGETVGVYVPAVTGVGDGVAAVSLNLTAVAPSGTGYVTAFPCSDAVPKTASLNVSAGEFAVANAVIVGVEPTTDTVCFYASTAMHLIVDVGGVWAEP